MYANSKFAVKKNNVRSKLGDYQKGVRQGDGLSPLLFNIYINDIDKIFDQNTSDPVVLESTQLNCLIYADDLLLLSEYKESFSKFYRRHYELISKYNVGLKTLLSEGLSEPEFYGDLVYKFKKLIGSNDFSFQFRKIITRYRLESYATVCMLSF